MVAKDILLYLTIVASWPQAFFAASLDGTVTPIIQSAPWVSSSGNIAKGIVWLLDGLIAPSGGNVTLELATPVSGPINLNSGGVVLNRDVVCNPGFSLLGNGIINAQGHAVHFSDDVTYGGELTVASDVVFNGHGNHLKLDTTSLVTIASGKKIVFKNMTLTIADGASFALTTGDLIGGLVFDNVIVVWGANYVINDGSICIKNRCRFKGMSAGCVITCKSKGSFTITKNARLLLNYTLTLRHDSEAENNFIFAGQSSELWLAGASFEHSANNSTLRLQDGVIVVSQRSTLAATGTAGYIDLGPLGRQVSLVVLPVASLSKSHVISA